MIEIDPERLGKDSASSAHRRRRCAGSVNLVNALRETNSLPTPEPDEDAQSGTIIHLAWCGRYSGTLTPMQAETLTTLQRLEKMITVDWAGNDEFSLLGREQRLWLHDGLEPIHSGQFDVAYGTLSTRRMLIIDGKTLFSEVSPAEENDQLRELVALARFNYPGCLSFTAVILQPWVSQRPNIAHYDEAEAELALRLLRLTIAESADPDAPRTPGVWCKHCPALAKCEEARAHIGMVYSLAQRIESGQFAIPIGTDGARVLDSIETAEIALKALRASYKTLLTHEPTCVPGWYLKAGNKVRVITDLMRAYEIARDNANLALDEFLSAVTLNVGTLEAQVAKEAALSGKRATDRFNELFGSVIGFKQNAPSLARVSPTKGKHKELKNDNAD